MASANPDGGLPLSYAIASSRCIDGLGVQAVLDAGLVDASQNGVGLIATISADGTDLTDHTLFWVGPNTTLKIQANNTWPDIGQDTQLVLNFNPQDLFFYPNSSSTQWVDGKDAIRRNEISIEGGEAQHITLMRNFDWVHRIAITTSNNIRQSKIILQILPISMATLDSLTDPLSPELCVQVVPIMSAPWCHPAEESLRMQGPIPVFRDRRSAQSKVLLQFPGSQTIKKFVRKVMLSCTTNPQLTDEEINDLILDPRKLPPSRPAVFASWPDLPADSTVQSIPKTGVTPAQASQQTRGVPVIAIDQTGVISNAQRSLGLQSGRAMEEGDSADLPPISMEAKNRQDVLLNMFEGDLPSNLPDWETLASMPLTDCLGVITFKRERAKDSSDAGSEAEAFKKATTPVVYDTVQVDDRLTKIHTASLLRAPLSEPSVYWSLLKKRLDQVVTVLPEEPFGVENGISDVAIKKMSDRTSMLQLKHILKSNSHVEKSAPVQKRRALESSGIGDTCEMTYVNDFDYKPARFPWEILECLSSAASVQQQLWPLDYSFHNILRCLIRFQLFHDPDINQKFQLLICKDFIDAVFLANSRKARCQLPPLSLKKCDDVALEVLRKHKRPQQLPAMSDLAASKGRLMPGQDPLTLTHTNMARAHNQAQAQIQFNQQQRYGVGGGARPKSSGRYGGPSRFANNSTASGPPIQNVFKPLQNAGVQVCPAFSKGIVCMRGGDSSGSCKAVNGTILHHICSICLKNTHGKDSHK